MAALGRFTLTIAIHAIGTARAGDQRVATQQRDNQFTGLKASGGAFDCARPLGVSSGFLFGDFDCGVECHSVFVLS